MFLDCFQGRRVLVTGHTGFKGSWLSLWLNRLGAHVTGLSIDVPTVPALFGLAEVDALIQHRIGDIRDPEAVDAALKASDAEIVFHLAAQPLVRLSYVEPLETLSVNVMGTAQVLEGVRRRGKPCSVIVITSDKCYANNGQIWGYREIDPMGGHDPYSMSKGAAELVVDSWRNSYCAEPNSKIRLASVRAGNVIGGGDWARDRLLTDCIAALIRHATIEIRNPLATRPWQHVLEPLSGYLWLAARLSTSDHPQAFAQSWNFGPCIDGVRPVCDLVDFALQYWGGGSWQTASDADQPHEAFALALNCDKAQQYLKWRPTWDFETSVAETIAWYREWANGASDIRGLTLGQIKAYETAARQAAIAWALPG
jgi:CDP-glucose 4,6-dehydratase